MYACYTVFNNEPTLRESLNSVLPYIEKVVAADGAWKGFPHRHASSTDATKEIFFELCGGKLIWVDCGGKPWSSETTARNQYVKHVPVGEWFIQIDGDEVIKGKVAEAFKFAESSRFTCLGIVGINYKPVWKGLKIKKIRGNPCFVYTDEPIKEEDWNGLQWEKFSGVARRFYRKIEGMQYAHEHCSMWVGKRRVRIQAVTKDVVLVNMPHKRGWEKWQRNLVYKQKARV